MPKLVTANLSNNTEPCILRYTTSDYQMLKINAEAFDADIIKHIYDSKGGLIVFNRPVTKIGCITDWNIHKLSSIAIPNGTTVIENGAFFDFQGLISVTIPNSITKIEEEAFGHCDNLEGVYISDLSSWCKINFSDSDANPLSYAKNIYLNGELIKRLVIPSDITKIEAFSFYNCKSLTSLIIPDSVTSIGWSAFNGCDGLTNVIIGKNVTSISEWAFSGCSGELILNCNIPHRLDYTDEHTWQSWEGNGTFCNADFTRVTIGNDVTSIGVSAFNRCRKLKSFHGKFASADNRCLVIDGTLISFASAELIEYTIPNGITKIGSEAFRNCSCLTTIIIPNSVTSLQRYAFNGCCNLTYINIPDSVSYIDDETFSHCTKLTSVTIGCGITYIGEDVFYHCKNLQTIICKAVVPPKLGTYGHINIPEDTTVIIPEGCEESYMNSDWKSLFEE